VETLGATEDGCERLIGDPYDVILDLLGGERRPAGLGVELELRRGGVVRIEPLLDEPRPQPPGGAELRGLLEDVVVGVEKNESCGATSSTSSPSSTAAVTYSSPFASVNATS